jgi:hypothetical protein
VVKEEADVALHEPKSRTPDATDDSEQRAYTRSTVIYSGRLAFGANDYSCAVMNISAGGAQLRMAQPVQAWTIVTLHIDRFGSFHARVVWQRGDRVGLQFLEDPILVTKRIVAASYS